MHLEGSTTCRAAAQFDGSKGGLSGVGPPFVGARNPERSFEHWSGMYFAASPERWLTGEMSHSVRNFIAN
jgi:hypothetical protein